MELELAKRIALDCVRPVLGTTGGPGSLSRLILHHSNLKELTGLKARLTLLRVMRREMHACKEHGSGSVPPSRATRKAWDSNLYQQPANFSVPTGL